MRNYEFIFVIIVGDCWLSLCPLLARELCSAEQTIATPYLDRVSQNALRELVEFNSVAPKIGTLLYRPKTSSYIDQFSNFFFQCGNHEKIPNGTITKDTTTPEMCLYITV